MKTIIGIVTALLMFPAQAWDFEIGAGQTQWNKPPNSQYWQQEFPHTFDLLSPAYYIGVTDASSHKPAWFNAWSNGLRYRFGWLDLGNVRGEAWATSEDANYSGTGGGCYDMSRCRPEDLNKWDTHGRTRGFEASVSPEWTVGPGKAFLKFGIYAHRPRVNVRIWRQDVDTGPTHFDYKQRINVGPVLGVGYTYKKASISLSCYKINANARGEDDPTNDTNPVNIPQNWSEKMCGTRVVMATWRF